MSEYEDEDDDEGGSGFLALLLGVGVGFGLALLFAPRAGDETRQLIVEKAKEGMEYAAVAVDELKMQVEDRLCDAGEAAQQLRDRVGDTVAGLKDKVQEAVRAGQEAYREELKDLDADLGTSLGSHAS
jgi:gas vesicle protein